MMVNLSPAVLWPPNHQMVPVAANILVKESCDAEPPAVELISITSNQPDNGDGDGNTTPDIAGAEIGTDDREFQLRAERGGREERVYRVIYRATDLSGNVTEEGGKVKVANM